MAVDAKYGRPNLTLRITSEKSDSQWVCCGYCSIQMVARAINPALNDNMSTIAHECRSTHGRPHNNGSNTGETRGGIKAATGIEVVAIANSGIPAALKAGKAIQYCCEYGALPSYVKTQGGSFGHSVCLFGWTDANGGCVGFFDPLYSQDSNGLWARWSDIDQAGWGGNAHNVSVKAAPKPIPPEPLPIPPPWVPFPTTEISTGYQRSVWTTPYAQAWGTDVWDSGDWDTLHWGMSWQAGWGAETWGVAIWR